MAGILEFFTKLLFTIVVGMAIGVPIGYLIMRKRLKRIKEEIPEIVKKEVEHGRIKKGLEQARWGKEYSRIAAEESRALIKDTGTGVQTKPKKQLGVPVPKVSKARRNKSSVKLHKPTAIRPEPDTA